VDAVAVCVSCGKGLCRECSIVIAGNTYCKTCVESEKWKALPTPPPAPPIPPPTAPPTPSPTLPPTPVKVEPTPTPTGVPSKAQFIVGGVGSILNTIASIPMFIFAIALWIAIISYYEEEYTYLYSLLAVGIVGFILLIIGIIMAAIGYFGFRRNYGSGMGTASFVFAIIVTVLLIIIAFIDIAIIYAGEPYYEYATTWAIVLVGQVIWFQLFGIMQILWGATHIVTRKFTGHSGLSLATGIMLIIAGILTLTFVMTSIGIALFFVAEIMASILFFISEVHTFTEP
jgi:hypothetical protein